MSIGSMTLQLPDGTSTTLVPKTSSPPPSGCYALKSWIEFGKTLMPPDTSNFCAVTALPVPKAGTGGVSYWITLPKGGPEIALLQRINQAPYGSPQWHYLVRPGSPGSLYQTMAADDDTPSDIRWFPIAIGSKGPGERNQLLMTGQLNNGFQAFAGIPRASDYSQYSPETHPWFFARVYCAHGQPGEVPTSIYDTPQGVLYMPIFAPADFAGSQDERGLWLDPDWLAGPVVPETGGPIEHELMDLAGMRVHVYRIDLSRVTPFVTPALGYKLTPAEFAAKYGMDFAINGDQGPWLLNALRRLLGGSLTSTGRWMSAGKWLSQATAESSIWLTQSGACKLAYAKPASFAPWHVISGPKLMLGDGVAQKPSYDDTFIAARSAFGLFDATHAAALAVEGNEGTSYGATEQDLLGLARLLQLRFLLELDSGGSTGCFHRNGVSYSVEDRRVLNCLCFKNK